MTITKDHKQGFAVAVVLFLAVYFIFLRKGKTSNFKVGNATINKLNCTSSGGTWVYNGASHQYECIGGALRKNGGKSNI